MRYRMTPAHASPAPAQTAEWRKPRAIAAISSKRRTRYGAICRAAAAETAAT